MIKGLSERRRLSRLGKIRLGIVVQEPGRKAYPKATEYFVVPESVAAVHGDRPTELPIMLPGDNPEKLFPQEYKLYRTSGLFCAGNGEVARRWTDKGELAELACPCPYLETGECKPLATLNLLLPEVPGLGVWQISTSSKKSITAINSDLERYSLAFGGLAGIPFILRLIPEQGQRWDESRGKMVKHVSYVLHLDSPLTLREILEGRRLMGKQVEALLPAPDTANLPLPAEEEMNGGDAPSHPPCATSDCAAAPPRAVAPEESMGPGRDGLEIHGGGGAHMCEGTTREILSGTPERETPPTIFKEGGEAPEGNHAQRGAGNAASGSGGPQERGIGTKSRMSKPRPASAGGEWTIERCYKEAQEVLGITARAYELYLTLAYPNTGWEVHGLAEQGKLLTDARHNPLKREKFLAVVVQTANKAARQGRLV